MSKSKPKKITKKTADNLSFNNTLEIMEYYQEEFKYRHEHYWNILFKMFIFNVIIIILPITSQAMGFTLSDASTKFGVIFPILGIFIAYLTKIILEDEAKKISAVNKVKYNINKTLPKKYRYYDYVPDKTDSKVQLAHNLIKIIFFIEIVLCIVVFIILYNTSILSFFKCVFAD